jgi:hypothetical protein
MTDFIEALGNLLTGLANYQPYRKPRRVFTRKFVVFCVLVAVFELVALNMYYGSPG